MKHGDTCSIVPYRACNVDDVCLIDRLCFIDPWLRRTFVEELSAPCAMNRVALLGPGETGRVIGFILGRIITDEYTIHRLAVHPEFQRRGFADRMLKICMQHAKLQDAKKCFIEVRAGNTAARRLYAACGFEIAGMRRAYYAVGSEDALLMQRDIEPAHCQTLLDQE